MNNRSTTQVVIVGAGPVGLGMVIELSRRGIACTVVDDGDGTVEHPRTGLVAIRTMELFRRWGLADRVRSRDFPEDYELSMVFCTLLNGWLLDREAYPSMRDAPTPASTPEKKQRCPQIWLHPILIDAARASGLVTLLFKRRFERFEASEDGVRAYVKDLGRGDNLVIDGSYLIGCDGASSITREQLGIKMAGRLLSFSVNILIRSPGLAKRHRMGEAERYMFVGPDGMWGSLTVVDGDEIWRLTVLGSEQKMDLASFDARHWVLHALGTEQDPNRIPFEITSVIPWRRSEALAERYSDGRIFLVGDSAHTMSPTGGMGMNTGMQEVLDLGWKLEGALAGWAGPLLLESYGLERRPIDRRNIAYSTANFRAWQDAPNPEKVCDDSEEGAQVRAALGKRLREATVVEWESVGLQIGHRYENSPICVPDGTPPTPDDFRKVVPTTRPGSRAPHAWMNDGRSTLDLFDRVFTLLSFDASRRSDAAALEVAFKERNIPLQVVSIDAPKIAVLYERPLVLVRPDGHVAWRGERVESPMGIVDTVRGAGPVPV